MKVFNIQPILSHQYYLWFKFWEQEPLFVSFRFQIRDFGVTFYKKR